MPARVFAFVLVDDAESYTAAQLAAGLRVSPAAISGAVRYLVSTGLLFRVREPGERVDRYRVYDDDVWSTVFLQRMPLLQRFVDSLSETAELLDPGRPGGRRILETLEFFRYIRSELPVMLDRWKQYRCEHNLDADSASD